jgi:hypothetical protein
MSAYALDLGIITGATTVTLCLMLQLIVLLLLSTAAHFSEKASIIDASWGLLPSNKIYSNAMPFDPSKS